MSLGVTGFAARTVLVDDVTSSVETRLRQEVEELDRLAAGNDPTTAQPFAGDLPAILDTFFRRNVTAADEGLYAFVDGEPFLTSASPPAELTADRAFVARMAEITEPQRGQVETTAGTAEYLAVPLVSTGPAGEPEVRGCSWWRSSPRSASPAWTPWSGGSPWCSSPSWRWRPRSRT
ncbi:hypothetical protein [Cellulomonas sp. ATA003]|uniref:hypothetical protein n=1 Tax=Cellulomonas sp. ATA003 TaxID=3073064 RepID=UPI002873B256|nr:hypothetical protein [Cellulomonas sp. ATA003]WNB87134.1 hypothetical protein REH70_08460 [Cellulomonas sp. ATA003]